jgi:hypothetical protein
MPPQLPPLLAPLLPPAATAGADRWQRCQSTFCGRCYAV